MRIAELCSLKPSNIDFKNNSLLIYGKGAKECIIQIGKPDVLSALLLYQEMFRKNINACGCFFVNRQGHRLSDQSVRIMINHYAKLAGIEQHITPYVFRHSYPQTLFTYFCSDIGMNASLLKQCFAI